ncbi:RagB/SusD family nutrient uptake outer membrane protein [Alkaliflexus imshenetskii]|uniref:RagB/SusD family nutrient uptake outer membrane protein n=1 Tax=Alkaliflexus imshenetskii TaxID=286730 RepID=UPI00047BECE0|nr:RagB/SusD family nutrient uptake outer membrane protein [Alkaliflexus imshenetskii]
MKRIKLFLLSILGVMVLNTSCEDFLNEEVITEVSVDYLYSSGEGLQVAVNALYNRMRRHNFPAQEGEPLRANVFFYMADDLGLNRTWHRPYGPNWNSSSVDAFKWTHTYQIIDRANAVITAARNVEMNETVRNSVLAQARIIRAELYLDLIRMYDNILLDTIATTPENAFDDRVYEVADPADVFKLIDDDLDFAIQHLPWSVEFGRYGKGVAHHIKGKSLLWQAQYLNMGNHKYAEAAAHFDAIVENGTHRLVALNQVFGQNLNHAEALFVYRRNEVLGGSDELAGGGGTWIGAVFQARFYEIPGGHILRDPVYGGEALGWSFPNDYLKSLYDQENDQRFTTYYYSEQLIGNNPNSPYFGQAIPESLIRDNFREYRWSLKKFFDEEKVATTNNSYKDNMLYRFAETLLLGAEAHWRADNQNPHNAKALEYINMIRTRAGVAPFTSFDKESYLEESARELAFEKNRWFLLKRIGELVQRQNTHYRYGSSSTNVVPEPMAPHMIRLPIPQSQIELMGTFPQNPGY